MNKSAKPHHALTPEEIAACAYEIYEREGRPEGRDFDHWLAAEAQLSAQRTQSARSNITAPTARSAPTPKRASKPTASPPAPTISRASQADSRPPAVAH